MSIYCVAVCLKTITGLSLTEKFVLLALCEKADNDGHNAYPSVETLARYAECSDRTVQRSLRTLRTKGFIVVAQKATSRRPSNYTILMSKFQGCQSVTSRASPLTNRGDTVMSPDPSKTRPIDSDQVVNGLDVQTFIAWWLDTYKEKRLGADYNFRKARDIPNIRRLLKGYGLERLKTMSELLLVTDDEWISTTDRGISILSSKAQWLDYLLRKHGR
jgi:hypothetical protein